MIEVNWIAIVLAALSAMIVGSIWYGPAFGKSWAKLANVKKDPNFTTRRAVILYVGAFLSAFATATVLAYAAGYVHDVSSDTYLVDTLFVGVVLSVGLVASRLYMQDSFEGRRKKLTALNASNAFVTYVVMAFIIGLLPV